ncbi:Pyruvate/Phosphoenolpyruvate kinase-like domain-containing protein [Aspergillus crustosus]
MGEARPMGEVLAIAGVSSGPKALRHLLETRGSASLYVPGVYDTFTARLVVRQGARILYVNAAGVALSRQAKSSSDVTTTDAVVETAGKIAQLQPVTAVIVDIEAGSPVNAGDCGDMFNWVLRCALSNVAAIQIHDRLLPCENDPEGHRKVVNRQTFLDTIQVIADARKQLESDIIVIARTDSQPIEGTEHAVQRLKLAQSFGVYFLSVGDVTCRRSATEIRSSLGENIIAIYNSDPGCPSTELSALEAGNAGFEMTIFPAFSQATVLNAMSHALSNLATKRISGLIAYYRQPELDFLMDPPAPLKPSDADTTGTEQ